MIFLLLINTAFWAFINTIFCTPLKQNCLVNMVFHVYRATIVFWLFIYH